jgi:RNA polymerase sigma-70 factor (ECF subfamily)
MTAAGDDPNKNEAEVPSSGQLALLPPQVTSLAVPLSPSDASSPDLGNDDVSDEALIAAIQRGEPRVGQRLYSRLVRVVDATVARVLGPGQPEHDDCVQAAFEEVLRTIYKGQFKGRCRLTSWAASIACHICLNIIRSRKTERAIFDRSEDPGAVSTGGAHPERAIEARDELRQLRAALATLAPARAEAVLLHDAFGYDLSEVAALTSSSEAAVQSRLSRGRRDLQERLGMLAADGEVKP